MNAALRFNLAILLCMLLAGTAASASAHPAADDFSQVDAYIHATMQRFPIPGLALAIVKGDQVVYLKGYGQANSRGDPVTPQTPFLIGSITKTFTALAIHQLQRAGQLSLDAPVQDYIPEFRLADEQAARRLTVRQLLDHTSGISTLEGNQPYLNSPSATTASMLAGLAAYRPQYPPGQHYEYSNTNYALLQEIITRASGQPYAEYVRKNLLDPLEMDRSSFADYRSLPGSPTYSLHVYGLWFAHEEMHVPAMLGVGYLNASAEDMAHYMTAYFNGGLYQGRDVLPARGPGFYDSNWNWHTGLVPADANDTFSGAHISTNAAMQLWHLRKLGVMVLMNTRLDVPFGGVAAFEIALDVARIVMGQPYALRSSSAYYASWALLDACILGALGSIAWQLARLRRWGSRLQAAAWPGTLLNVAIGVAALMFPLAFGMNWPLALYWRPDLSGPILAIGLGLGGLGLLKAGLLIRRALARS